METFCRYFDRLLAVICLLVVFHSTTRAQDARQFQFSRLDIQNGLSHNQVTCIFKDSKGFMWFGTLAGLNRYDGYTFKVFRHSPRDSSSLNDDYIVDICEGPGQWLWVLTRRGLTVYDPKTESFSRDISKIYRWAGLPDPYIASIRKDSSGRFWFLHYNDGLYLYRKGAPCLHLFHDDKNPASIYSNAVSDIQTDSRGNTWLLYTDGMLEQLDSKTLKVKSRVSQIQAAHPPGTQLKYNLFVDAQNDLWVYAPNYASGLYFYRPSAGRVLHLIAGIPGKNLNANIVTGVIQDTGNRIWIATDHGGINLLDKQSFSLRYLENKEDDNKSLSQNSLMSMMKDNTGIIWIGTFKRGLSYYHDNIIKFSLYTHRFSDLGSLPFNDVNRFIEDPKGNLWLGTNGGGLIYYDRTNGKYTTYRHHAKDAGSLANDVVISLAYDRAGLLWVGTFFGGLDCFDGKHFRHYRHDDSKPESLSDDRVWSILEDSRGRFWVGTLGGGLNLLDRKTGKFSHFRANDQNSIHSDYVSDIIEDRQSNIWVSAAVGVYKLDHATNWFSYYEHEENKPQSLVNDNVNSLTQDSRGLIWMTTRDGISILNPSSGHFQNLHKEDGLPENATLDVLEDASHAMWVSTANGLSRIQLRPSLRGKYSFNFANFSRSDGLQDNAFNQYAALKMRSGELLFGGANGFNIFRPETLAGFGKPAKPVLTGIQLFNRPLGVGDTTNGHVVLQSALSYLSELKLHHNENSFSIEFSSPNFFNPERVKLEYRLDGFDTKWISDRGNFHQANYTNLDPGDYTFRVRVQHAGPNTAAENQLKVTILYPFWRTPLAYLIYGLAFFGLLFAIRRRGIRRLRKEFAIEKERGEAQRMHELDLMKIRFFTNVSHEFRTPISLIMAPVEKMIRQLPDAAGFRNELQLMSRNARRLLNMVDQLLDFRKLEVQELKIQENRGEIISFLRDLCFSFTDLAAKKHIQLEFRSSVEQLQAVFDHGKMERIMFNLLSNAFKFTPDSGQVSVSVSHAAQLVIQVKDSGIGIPGDILERIFDPFFQNDLPGSMINQGSGIGLSITREYVRLLGGEIWVSSATGEGATFTIQIPVQQAQREEPPAAGDQTDETPGPGEIPAVHETDATDDRQPVLQTRTNSKSERRKPEVLIVEDNDDFRFYLKDNLSHHFHIIEAENGKRGWQKTLAQHPDLVVSDISMPEMNGIDLCAKIKADERTRHIPVLLLTALIGEEHELRGLEIGASDYLTKPFNFEILVFKIKNLLVQQDTMRRVYKKQVELRPSEIETDSPDDVFMQKVMMLVEKNISNSNFSIEELSDEVFVSRYTLYKRILSMTGKTPNEFLRAMRLKRAAQLLETGHLSIAQVCGKVGFKSQKYFVKAFKAEFNLPPSAWYRSVKVEK